MITRIEIDGFKSFLDFGLDVPRGIRSRHGYYFDFLAENVDLRVLPRLPAYAEWVSQTEKALEGLGYL